MAGHDVTAERDRATVGKFVERLSSVLVEAGIPRMPARMFAALFSADSGKLTAEELSKQLQASPAAVSARALPYLAQIRQQGQNGGFGRLL
jgi:hypothetical protein